MVTTLCPLVFTRRTASIASAMSTESMAPVSPIPILQKWDQNAGVGPDIEDSWKRKKLWCFCGP
jgi:hypothetical protein